MKGMGKKITKSCKRCFGTNVIKFNVSCLAKLTYLFNI